MIGRRKVRQVMSDMRMVCNEAQRIWSDLGAFVNFVGQTVVGTDRQKG